MEAQHASVLITGGSEGIGLGLATRFLRAGSQVLITGRDPAKLARAAAAFPGLQTTYVNDIGLPAQREELARHVRQTMPTLSIVWRTWRDLTAHRLGRGRGAVHRRGQQEIASKNR